MNLLDSPFIKKALIKYSMMLLLSSGGEGRKRPFVFEDNCVRKLDILESCSVSETML